VPVHEGGKRFFGPAGGVLAHQFHVAGCHSPIHARPKGNGDNFFGG
jgi:hypothetical protein